jgi:hypothetical protein
MAARIFFGRAPPGRPWTGSRPDDGHGTSIGNVLQKKLIAINVMIK